MTMKTLTIGNMLLGHMSLDEMKKFDEWMNQIRLTQLYLSLQGIDRYDFEKACISYFCQVFTSS